MNTQLNYTIARQPIADLSRISARPGQRWMAVAAVLVGAGWGSTQFTPMLLVYRHALGLGPGSLEAMFGVYALGLIPGLLLAGPLSDARGRRLPVLAAAAMSLLGSLLLIAGSGSPALLYVARFVVGLGSGAAFSAGTAWLRELSLLPPGERRPRPGGTAGGGGDDDRVCGGAAGVRDACSVGTGEPGSAVSASCGVHGRGVVRVGPARARDDHTANAVFGGRRAAGRAVATAVLAVGGGDGAMGVRGAGSGVRVPARGGGG